MTSSPWPPANHSSSMPENDQNNKAPYELHAPFEDFMDEDHDVDEFSPHPLFKEKEWRILQLLFERQQAFPSTLAYLSSIHRSEVYDICKKLTQEGWLAQHKEGTSPLYYSLDKTGNTAQKHLENIFTLIIELHHTLLKTALPKNPAPKLPQNKIQIFKELFNNRDKTFKDSFQIIVHFLHEAIPHELSCFVFLSFGKDDLYQGRWLYSPKTNLKDFEFISKGGKGAQAQIHQKNFYENKDMETFFKGMISQESMEELQKHHPHLYWYYFPFSFSKSVNGERGLCLAFKEKLTDETRLRYSQKILFAGHALRCVNLIFA